MDNLQFWSEQDFPTFSENRDMKICEFLKIPPIPVNRHVEERAIKKTIELLKPMAKHREVDLLHYTGPTVTKPALFRQGQTYVLDGNTRSYIWNTYRKGSVVNTKIDHTESPLPIPRQVNVRVYSMDNAMDAIELYYIIDSKDAVEEKAHKITGVYRANNLSNFKNTKIRRGLIATALNVACPINSKKTFSIYVDGVEDSWEQIPHLRDVLQDMDKLDAPGRGHFHVQPATGVAMLAGLACQCDNDWTRAVERLAKTKLKLRETWQDEPNSNILALLRGNVENVVGTHNAMPYDIGFGQAPTIVLNYLSYCWLNIIEGSTVESEITEKTIEGMYKNLVELAYGDLAKS